MKKLLISLLSIGVVSAVAIGATSAYFTDTEVLGTNTISTGTISLRDARDTWMLNVNLSNLKPGDFVRKWVVLENDGSLDIKFLRINAINKTGDLTLLDNVNVTVYNTVTGYEQGIFTPNWGTGQPISPWLTDIDVLGTAVYRDATAGHIMVPGSKSTMILDFRVPTTLGNEFQGLSASFDLEFTAEQVH